MGEFSLYFREKSFSSVSRAALVSDFDTSSPHDAALKSIFGKIIFKDKAERDQARDSVTNIQGVAGFIRKQGTTEDGREEIRRHSMFLAFDATPPPLTFTAHNITKVLEAIANPDIKESEFPIYPPAILFPDRRDRLWSAFGSSAPSFRVPGGKKMDLRETFQVVERSKVGEKTSRAVRKIGFILKKLDESLSDLHTMIDDKFIMNPHGAAIMSRASSSSLVKTLEKEQCESVVAALRKVAQVTVSDPVDRAGKRKADADVEEGPSKKTRADDL